MKMDKSKWLLNSQKKKQQQPDHQLKPLDGDLSEEAPQIYKIVKRGNQTSPERREVLKKLAASMSLSALATSFSGCGDGSDYTINANNQKCLCHVVCVCDTEADKKKSIKSSTWISQHSNTTCTCDTVCTCNTVCTCDSVSTCTCDSEGSSSGGGGHYWYGG
jgi:hypothetical protein